MPWKSPKGKKRRSFPAFSQGVVYSTPEEMLEFSNYVLAFFEAHKNPAEGKEAFEMTFFTIPWKRQTEENNSADRREPMKMEKNSNSLRPWIYLAGFSMSGFSSGLITCINTLLFLSRGLSLSLFSLAIGLNFITVMVLEMPSGIAGDLWGRKRVWMFPG